MKTKPIEVENARSKNVIDIIVEDRTFNVFRDNWKLKRNERLIEYLKYSKNIKPIRINCQSGVGYNKDLKFLVRNNYLEMKRHVLSWSEWSRYTESRLHITEKGIGFLNE